MSRLPSTLATRLATIFALAACASESHVATQPDGIAQMVVQAGRDTPVTTYVSDADATTAPSLQIRSDGLGAYANSKSVSSVIQSVGAWVLDSRILKTATRRVLLDFGQPVAGSGPGGGSPIALPSGLYKVRAISKCNVYGRSMWTLAPGATMTCPLHIAFDFGGVDYALQMNPDPAGDPDGAPETQPANITCVSPTSGSGPCVAWQITPSGTYMAPNGSTAYRNVTRLIQFAPSGRLNQGDFYFSFSIRVTNP
jgi:hypothetical protein